MQRWTHNKQLWIQEERIPCGVGCSCTGCENQKNHRRVKFLGRDMAYLQRVGLSNHSLIVGLPTTSLSIHQLSIRFCFCFLKKEIT